VVAVVAYSRPIVERACGEASDRDIAKLLEDGLTAHNPHHC
jgi:hypothetical protein